MSAAPSQPKVKAQRIAKASPFIAAFSILTIVIGALSWILVAEQFGATSHADLLFWATLVPVMFGQHTRGALNLAFVPSFAGTRVKGGEEQAWRLASSFANLVVGVALGVVLVYALVAPLGFRWMTGRDPEAAAEFARLTWILAWILVLWVVFAVVEALLYSYQHYTTTAFSTMISTIGLIVGVKVLGPRLGILGAAIGMTGGYVVQAMVPAARLLPYRHLYRRGVDWSQPEFREAVARLGPIVIFSVCMLGGFGVAYAVCARLGEGRVAAFRYCTQLLIVLPALVNSAIVAPLYPRMAEKVAEGDHDTLKWMLQTFVRMVFFLMLPFVVLLMALRVPIVQALFERGAFTPESTRLTAMAVLGLAPWVLAMTLNQLPTSLAMSVGKARLLATMGAVLLPIMGALGFAMSKGLGWDVAGISAAFSLNFWISFPLLLLMLRRELGSLGMSSLLLQNVRTLAAAAAMGVVISLPARLLTSWLDGLSVARRLTGASLTLARLGECAVLGLAGLALYVLLARLARVPEALDFRAAMQSIRGPKAEPAAPNAAESETVGEAAPSGVSS
ncbi:MAG: lipid II flippase MurJ [bacterium]